jgi:hypothetical protein
VVLLPRSHHVGKQHPRVTYPAQRCAGVEGTPCHSVHAWVRELQAQQVLVAQVLRILNRCRRPGALCRLRCGPARLLLRRARRVEAA